MINVLIVEDSPVAQKLIEHILSSDSALNVMGMVANGVEAIEFLKTQQPDVITMDIDMPKMDGFEATRYIMETQPVPIIIVSASYSPSEVELTFRALEAGAVAAAAKPNGPHHPEYETLAKRLIQTVKAMSEVKVIRRWTRRTVELPVSSTASVPSVLTAPTSDAAIKIVAIGISTGGPPILETILSRLPSDFAAPVVIVQHIAAGFLPGLVNWLNQATEVPVSIAQQGEILLPGHVYLAPDGWHLGVSRNRVVLGDTPPEGSLRPAASYLFRSVAKAYGAQAIGVLLTGMGRDGAEELKIMRDKGAITFAQDEATSVVHGMPGEAIKLGAAMHVMPPDKIAAALVRLVGK